MLKNYTIDDKLWPNFCDIRNIHDKYICPQVLTYDGKKLITFAKNNSVLTIHINAAIKDKPPFVCTLFNMKTGEKTRSFSGDIFNIISQYKIEILLEKYFLLNNSAL